MQRLGGRLQESNHREPLPRRGPGTSTLWKIILLHAMSIKVKICVVPCRH